MQIIYRHRIWTEVRSDVELLVFSCAFILSEPIFILTYFLLLIILMQNIAKVVIAESNS